MKKFIAFVLTLILAFSVAPSAFAASDTAMNSADALHALGLFDGVGADANGNPNYDLDRAPTRAEAITMLVRLLGKAEEAKAKMWTTPFTDVADWAKPYVGYAYANKLTMGTSATTFGNDDKVSATQYLTFVLRALGYESGSDFQWDKAWELTDKIGITNGEYNANSTIFLRGDVVIISNNALPIQQKGNGQTLAEKLIADGIFTKAQYDHRNNTSREETEPQSEFDLIEFLMSQNPTEVGYGYADGRMDHYFYADQYNGDYLAKTIFDHLGVLGDYEFHEHTQAEEWDFIGTRVEVAVAGDYVNVGMFYGGGKTCYRTEIKIQ